MSEEHDVIERICEDVKERQMIPLQVDRREHDRWDRLLVESLRNILIDTLQNERLTYASYLEEQPCDVFLEWVNGLNFLSLVHESVCRTIDELTPDWTKEQLYGLMTVVEELEVESCLGSAKEKLLGGWFIDNIKDGKDVHAVWLKMLLRMGFPMSEEEIEQHDKLLGPGFGAVILDCYFHLHGFKAVEEHLHKVIRCEDDARHIAQWLPFLAKEYGVDEVKKLFVPPRVPEQYMPIFTRMIEAVEKFQTEEQNADHS